MDELDIAAPPEVIAALKNGRQARGWIKAFCPRCDPNADRRHNPTLWAGIKNGRPCWGCFRNCGVREDYYAGRKFERMKLGLQNFDHIADDRRRIQQAIRIFERTQAIRTGDMADRYLRGARKLAPVDPQWPTDLRFCARVWHNETKRDLPAMVAVIRDRDGQIVGVHRTYLAELPDRTVVKADDKLVPKKIRIKSAKLALGSISGAAIRLGAPSQTIAVCEGIETALAFSMFNNMPCWSTVSSGGMISFQIPSSITRLVIGPDLGDKTSAGMKAALSLRVRMFKEARDQKRKIIVQLRPPIDGVNDWAQYAELVASRTAS